MPKKITISTAHQQVLIDGEPFRLVLADEPVVEKVGDHAYQVTFTTYAQEVDFVNTLLDTDQNGDPFVVASSDRFFDQDCPDFVYGVDGGDVDPVIEEYFGTDFAKIVNEI